MSVCGVSKAHLVIVHLVSGLILLYIGYFVLFLPFDVKFMSLLDLLFAISLLLLIAFVTGVVGENCAGDRLCGGGVGYLLVAYGSVVDRLMSEGNSDRNEELQCVEDFGMFEVLFGSSETSEVEENGVDENPAEAPLPPASEGLKQGDLSIGESKGCEGIGDEIDSIPCPQLKNVGAGSDERRSENFLKILDQFERMTSNVEEKKIVQPSRGSKANKIVEKYTCEDRQNTSMVKISSPVDNKCEDVGDSLHRFDSFDHSYRENAEKLPISRSSSQSFDEPYEHGNYGSMRKEKEWRRTLACKLFEERHHVSGVEGMDSLWEAYEIDGDKPAKSRMDKKNSRVKREIEEEDEEEDQVRQLCCLQALKLSSGKMNLGMRKANLVKITKAIKGFGWLHHVSSKHSKKVHNSGDNRY